MRNHVSNVLLILLAIVILLVWFWPKKETPTGATQSTDKVKNDLPQAADHQALAQPVSPPPSPLPAAEDVRADGKRELHAYRIAVRGGVLSLDGMQRIVGDFHRRGGPLPWMPGMWCVRLLDADMRVLAEDTANAPDDACVVLDPQNRDANGQPQATQFAGAGEEAMLQVRLPPHSEAKWLKVYRLAGSERADWNTEPTGKLLTSIPLP